VTDHVSAADVQVLQDGGSVIGHLGDRVGRRLGQVALPTPRLSKVITRKCGESSLTWKSQFAEGAESPLMGRTGSPSPSDS